MATELGWDALLSPFNIQEEQGLVLFHMRPARGSGSQSLRPHQFYWETLRHHSTSSGGPAALQSLGSQRKPARGELAHELKHKP